MNQGQKPGAERILLFFSITVFIALIIFSLLPTAFSVGDFHFRPVDIVSDLRGNNAVNPGGNPDDSTELAEEKEDEQRRPGRPPLPDYHTYAGIINYDSSQNRPLQHFTQAIKDLQQGKRQKVRIAYFGDSFIEGDIITMDFRKLLQMKFGGSGVGFVPITSISAGFRTTITHSFNGWSDFNFSAKGDGSHLFISGHNYTTAGSGNVSLTGVKDTLLRKFEEVYVLLNDGTRANATINGMPVNLPAGNGGLVKTKVAADVQQVKLNASGSAVWYGLSVEPRKGVIVDNFTFRGISGIEYKYLDENWLKQIAAAHQYDLMVFQFGPNLLFKPSATKFTYYEKPMIEELAKFKRAFAPADILLVSTGDKAFKYSGVYKTAEGVLPLLQTQHHIARQSGINFWNLYLNMGGEGSMIKWVTGDTAFANKDYTHVNFKGGKKIATLLFNSIMKEYQKP